MGCAAGVPPLNPPGSPPSPPCPPGSPRSGWVRDRRPLPAAERGAREGRGSGEGTRRGRGVPGRRPPASAWLAPGGEEDPKSAWKEGGESNPDGADGALVLNLETGPWRRKLQVIFPSAHPPEKII